MKLFFAFIMVVLSSSSFAEIQLFDSGAKPSSLNWNIVNDTVMGGRSSSRWISKSSSPCSFEGYLSLENNGGFASVRCDLNNENLTKTEGIFIRVKGDGRKYQFRIRSQASRWANYSHEFKTVRNKIKTFYLPFKDFEPSWRGRSLNNLPVLKGKDVRGIGFLLGDKIQGKFQLEILSISATTKKAYNDLVKNLTTGDN
ncbi:MAG: CIA30 family protein [Verrucomicrobiota bacterium]|jgi:NADH dehydrogenase [ubiquinone] 1 alpha subcomplex assembly factor 1|nr:CIA30 family protein [Verrucomicrobiota bacterium]